MQNVQRQLFLITEKVTRLEDGHAIQEQRLKMVEALSEDVKEIKSKIGDVCRDRHMFCKAAALVVMAQFVNVDKLIDALLQIF